MNHTNDSLIEFLVEELTHSAGAELLAWIAATFGKPLTVYRGVNWQQMPCEDDCPWLGLWSRAQQGGDAAEREKRVIGIAWGIVDGPQDVRTEDDGLVRRVTGVGASRIDTFHRLTIEAISAALLAEDVELVGYESEFSDGDTYPLNVVESEIRIEWDQTIGA